VLYLTQTVGGIVMAFSINSGAGLLATVIAGGLLVYSAVLKKRFLIGHLAIATMGALLLPYGGIAAGSLTPTLYTTPVVFLAFLGREILKTVPDVEGDREHGVDNLATRYGPATAAVVGKLLLTVCVVLLPLTNLLWALNGWFLVIALLVIAPGTLLVLYVLNRRDAEAQMHTILRLSKLLFLLVAAAWLIGSVRG
jgi:4-hydroxybenzoate polyprenyltransferase